MAESQRHGCAQWNISTLHGVNHKINCASAYLTGLGFHQTSGLEHCPSYCTGSSRAAHHRRHLRLSDRQMEEGGKEGGGEEWTRKDKLVLQKLRFWHERWRWWYKSSKLSTPIVQNSFSNRHNTFWYALQKQAHVIWQS